MSVKIPKPSLEDEADRMLRGLTFTIEPLYSLTLAWPERVRYYETACVFCGHHILHEGRPARACYWDWYVRWIGTWNRIGMQYAMETLYG